MSSVNENQVLDWLALSFVTGVGSRTAAQLIDRFGSPTACLDASAYSLEAAGLKTDSIDELKSTQPRERAGRDLEQLRKIGGEALTLIDPRYPELLKATYDPPIVLYVLGDLDAALDQAAIAVVGSRRCSTYGRNVAEKLSRELAERGITVISGLARGIDSAAHRGALEGKGLTVAVMGTGLDDIYPKENRKLADQIAAHGALLTEFPLETPPVSQNFPFRNRVISGLAQGVMVVEAAERSGSLITARLAMEQGREVFAVPGNVTSAKSFGPNYLIKDGAKLVQTWRDVVEELPAALKAPIISAERGEPRAQQMRLDQAAISNEERRVLARLKVDESTHIDQLIATSGLELGQLMGALLKLEMSDLVRQLPGKSFVRKM
ncbi:MAG TPA: DNA-processing protein DprA [Blastocatellia bacterium]|jgi:DNA processing protein|nr:DNA-processing protein DprA [Blastocatellia bacterium]